MDNNPPIINAILCFTLNLTEHFERCSESLTHIHVDGLVKASKSNVKMEFVCMRDDNDQDNCNCKYANLITSFVNLINDLV